MWGNSEQSWGSLSKTFHWLIVGCILVQGPAGYLMAITFPLAFHDPAVQPLQTFASQVHHTLGLFILALVLARLAWRQAGPVPAQAPGRGLPARTLARATHAVLYGLLLFLPLSGWAALSAEARATIWFFGAQHLVPPIFPAQPRGAFFGYGFFAHLHVYAVWVAAVVICLHVGAAFWHLLVLKDNVFRRMWPLAQG